MTRKLFQIGYNKCGTTFIARLFEMNGYRSVHWAEGALAEDIAFSKLAGVTPLRPWAATTVAFTDMESVRYLNMPIVEAFKEYRFLDESYPGSVFLLNTRRVEDWVVSRYGHRGGSYARAQAQIRGVAVAGLADLWAEEWTAHLTACRAYFAGRADLVEIDIDHAGPADYRDALAPWFDLPLCPPRPGARAGARRAASLAPLARVLIGSAPRPDRAPPGRISAAIVRAARPARSAPASAAAKPAPSPAASLDDRADASVILDLDRDEVRDSRAGLLPLRRGPGGFFHAGAATARLLRIATTVNDIAQATDRGRYRIDMRPGLCQPQPRPLLACCRRAGATNVFLWPMPWTHRLGNDGYLGRPGRLDPPFEAKRDQAVFRGPLAGHMPGRAGQPGRSSVQQAVADVLAGGPPTLLRHAARVAAVLRHHRAPGIDMALTPDKAGQHALERAGLAHLIAPAPDDDFLLSHRYLVCLGATSGAEDFLPLANSRSVVLLEEDGWESFARGVFQPWLHYIPLSPGAEDLAERLAWARAHPETCQQISARARALCAALADPQSRRVQLAAILRSYRRAARGTV